LGFGFARGKGGSSSLLNAVFGLRHGFGAGAFEMTNVYLGMTKLPESPSGRRKSKQLSGAALFDLVGNMHL